MCGQLTFERGWFSEHASYEFCCVAFTSHFFEHGKLSLEGLCPGYTSPSVRRLKDLYNSQEDLSGTGSNGFISPNNYMR